MAKNLSTFNFQYWITEKIDAGLQEYGYSEEFHGVAFVKIIDMQGTHPIRLKRTTNSLEAKTIKDVQYYLKGL